VGMPMVDSVPAHSGYAHGG